mmetsp:Transcript_499/g.437  ORF Transcript_499/g.437 Transcript_499/m.437 type:complete len:444 (+) Transcript_499:3-1334(+)
MIRPWLGMLMKGRALASAASLVVLPASIRPAPWQADGCRRYRLMRDHLSPVPKSLLANVVQMPEVIEGRRYFVEGKFSIAIQHLARADEISKASGMAELSLLTSETLAYLHALSGDFSKEASYRAQCVQASSTLQANTPGIATDLTLFDCLHNWALSDIKCGLLNTATLAHAREVARRVGKGGKGLVRTCDMTEALAAIDGSHSSVSVEQVPAMVSALTDAVTDECGGEAALTGSAYLILAVALHRLGQRASGEGMEAEAACQKAIEMVDAACIEAEAYVKVGALLFLSRMHLEREQSDLADKAASEALAVAEKALLQDAVDAALYQLATVRMSVGDFVVAEGLFRTCTAKLTQAPQTRSPTTWEMVQVEKASEQHSAMLEGMSFNNHSRQPEAVQIREKLKKLQDAFPVTAAGATRLRESALDLWYVRAFSPNLPTLLQDSD